MLIDAGIGPRVVDKRLEGSGMGIRDISAICLTHLDRDHFNPTWLRLIARCGIKLFCHARRVQSLLGRAAESIDPRSRARVMEQLNTLVTGFDGEPFEAIEGLKLRPLRLEHDAAGSHGFVIDGFGCRIGYATDLGHVPQQLVEQFDDVDVLALESNYDPDMQLQSARPWFLKRRIMGGSGHLSNQQAFEAIKKILNRCESRRRTLPDHIVLLHRSRHCNCPRLMKDLFARDHRIAPRLVLTEQHRRSRWLRAVGRERFVGEQMLMFA
jgi:phosphoribosyl 1,2-cyclic phosphodiesterase